MNETIHTEWTTLHNRLLMVISANAAIPLGELLGERDLRSDLHMDSFTMVNTINAIEQEFFVTISDSEMEQLRTISDVIRMLWSKICAVSSRT